MLQASSVLAACGLLRRPDELIEWMDLHSSDPVLSAVIIAEIADGIAKAKRGGR
jgi:hypothetical protein